MIKTDKAFIPYIAPSADVAIAGAGAIDVHSNELPANIETFQRTEASTKQLTHLFHSMETVGSGPAKSRILSCNVDSWNARWDLLEKATTSIDTSYFSLERDVYGMAFLGHIFKKMNEGVGHVRILTDAMADNLGQRGFTKALKGRDYLQEMVERGAQVGVFNPLWIRPLQFNAGAFASVHDKILTVDGKAGITGGRNIGREYLTSEKDMPHAWRDMDVVIEGEGPAKGLAIAVDREYTRKKEVSYVGKEKLGNLVKRDLELIGAYLLMDIVLKKGPCSAEQTEALRKDPAAREAFSKTLVEGAIARLPAEGIARAPNERELKKLNEMALELAGYPELNGSYAKYQTTGTWHEGEVKVVDQMAQKKGTRINEFVQLEQLLRSSTKRIVIENPYIVMTEEMINILSAAAARGVEITMYTNSPLSTDSEVTQAFFLRDWPLVLARVPTMKIFVATGVRKFHTKSLQIDDQFPLISSYNADILSGQLNSEVGAMINSPSAAAELTSYFEQDYADPSNGFLQYTIKKDADGKAVLNDGEPIVEFGPNDHLSPEIIEHYRKKCDAVDMLRSRLAILAPLNHPRKLNIP